LHVDLGGDRRLQYLIAGDGDALLVYHHGTPAAGPIGSSIVDAAGAAGFTVAELVRPGYGESTRQEGRTVADVVPLVEALADHLGFDRFVTMGWSGGGPHALATAALLPRRCAAAMCLASVGPFGEPDLVFLAGMGEDNIAEFGAALAGPDDLAAFLRGAEPGLREVTAADVIDSLRSLLPAVDQDYLTGREAQEMADELRWSLAHGIWGWFDDDVAFTRPWGIDLTSIVTPVQIWQGTDDLMVPFAHGEWLAEHVPTADAHLVTGQGHLSLAAQALSPGFLAMKESLQNQR
jgi:pimeloyl-ACP methyl ester carboxylesterase